jgi:hypothetical protein
MEFEPYPVARQGPLERIPGQPRFEFGPGAICREIYLAADDDFPFEPRTALEDLVIEGRGQGDGRTGRLRMQKCGHRQASGDEMTQPTQTTNEAT